ncbi:MAG: agmatine deiminase family protein [Xanthomonadales bacterium]|nr:agmatine deiminase family protein [Xanthomonadales bacterium]
MKAVATLLLTMLAAPLFAAELRLADPAYLATIKDDEPTLPRGFTPEERARWRLPDLSRMPLVPPTGSVDTPAEYERNDGLLIRWGSQNALLTEMAVAMTNNEPDMTLYVVVSSSLQASAATTLANAGTNMSRVQFIVGPSGSVWIRDYGPRYIVENGRRSMVDHVYNRPRPLDDVVPGLVAQHTGETKFDSPLTHGGGNFHLFADGSAYMTRLIANENPSLSEQQIRDYYLAYQGLDVTLTDPLPQSFDSTQHIDMWMLPADGNRVIVNEYPNTGGIYTVPREVTEATATLLASRGKTVLRIGGWRTSAHYTYANAVILNNTVLTCQFNGYAAENANALAVFQQAFPSRTIVPINCSSIIGLSGAIHCIVMHMPEVLADLLLRNGFE